MVESKTRTYSPSPFEGFPELLLIMWNHPATTTLQEISPQPLCEAFWAAAGHLVSSGNGDIPRDFKRLQDIPQHYTRRSRALRAICNLVGIFIILIDSLYAPRRWPGKNCTKIIYIYIYIYMIWKLYLEKKIIQSESAGVQKVDITPHA